MVGVELITEVFLSCRMHLASMLSRLVPPNDIEDIVQETYVKVCQFNSKEKIRAPRALMFRIARNLAIDHIKRAEWRLNSSLDEDSEMEIAEARRMADEPLSQAVSDEEFALFCEAIRRLPLKCRRVFVLKKVYGYSQREIATELNLSENTVEKHIAKGMKRCVHFMQQCFDSGKGNTQILRHTALRRGNR